jgi:hypothetical protein
MILYTIEDVPIFPTIYLLFQHTPHNTPHNTHCTSHTTFIILPSPYFVRMSHSNLLRHWCIPLIFDCFLTVIPTLLFFFLTPLTTFTRTHIDLVFRNTNNFTSVGFRRETATLIFLVIEPFLQNWRDSDYSLLFY